jgi:hypothetical protein
MSDADGLSRDRGQGAGDSHELAAALAGAAIELNDRHFVLHGERLCLPVAMPDCSLCGVVVSDCSFWLVSD